MKVLGVDMGSREVKIALMEQGQIIFKKKISTMTFYRDYCTYNGKLEVDMDKLGLEEIGAAVSTGYGRNNTDLAKFKAINEIKAHVYGALFQTRLKDFVLLDIGGQDVKVIRVEKGIITDMELNEKCAASCGRYLENMAGVLEISLEEMSKYHEEPIELNSTCSVFSESELIGKIAEGINIEYLCAGVNYSLYKRLRPLLTKFSGRQLVVSGGVAHNFALNQYLKNDFDEIVELEGCCYYLERKC
jgi:predicted CoA-substrate-specific enzyme activase